MERGMESGRGRERGGKEGGRRKEGGREKGRKGGIEGAGGARISFHSPPSSQQR